MVIVDVLAEKTFESFRSPWRNIISLLLTEISSRISGTRNNKNSESLTPMKT
jgi:hypothetical protein